MEGNEDEEMCKVYVKILLYHTLILPLNFQVGLK